MRRTLLPLAIAALITGCGGSNSGLLTDNQASELLTAVDDVDRALGGEDCAAARQAALRGAERATELRRDVDPELKANLRDWFEHVADRVRRDCGRDEEPEETPTPEPTPDETPTPEPTPTATPTPEPTPDPTPTPDDDGDGTGGVEPGPGTGVVDP